ncbi:wall-associated receptor kinase-like 2 [Silene latifolia]|uniref:wall-associated receptor kinase-like 2 n=1 Tax=Silene latifolia TaxID=37657 RepID=UPI003D774658
MGQIQTKKKYMHFIENGGIFLEKQIALSRGQNKGSITQMKILSIDEIEKATNNYDPSLVLGSTQSTVFKGVIDGQVVAIKSPRDFQLNHDLIDLYLTEAATSMVMNHENLVKIYGTCLETYIPIMVYEYMPKGTLYTHLHNNSSRIKWSDRLRVAIDIAYALSYMHNALSRPLAHRDVQSYNILLDDSFRAKLSNLGYAVSIIPKKTANKRPIVGYPGCVDPEYIETELVTEKCDVYSFGVLLLELLTGKHPIKMAIRNNKNLVDIFVSSTKKNGMMEMIDSYVLEQARDDEIREVASLALTCVAKKGDERPTMIDVVRELCKIQDQDKNKS